MEIYKTATERFIEVLEKKLHYWNMQYFLSLDGLHSNKKDDKRFWLESSKLDKWMINNYKEEVYAWRRKERNRKTNTDATCSDGFKGGITFKVR